MSRLTRKQRLKLKRQQEADHKAFMRRGEIRRDERAARDRASTGKVESPRDRHLREQRERDEARLAERRAEHEVMEGRRWAVATACVGREADLVGKLRESRIPYFRAQDDVVQVLPSGRVRKVRVPILPRTVFVGVEDRSHIDQLAASFPWLMERVPGQRFGRLDDGYPSSGCGHRRFDRVDVGDTVDAPGESFPWHIDHMERLTGTDDDGEPAAITALVPEDQMRAFADCLIGSAPILENGGGIELGETVRVTEGPFASFSATVEEIDHARCRLRAAVSIFGRSTPVELEFQQIERA